jgi:hypothetical protein
LSLNDSRVIATKKYGFRLLLTLMALATLAAVSRAGASGPTVGLIANEPAAFQGYTLLAPLESQTSYLVDNDGRLVHSWQSAYLPGASAYLLDDGSLLRAGVAPNAPINGAGGGGVVERIAWDGTLEWQYQYSDALHRQHHDIRMMPNGNVLMIAWEYKTGQEALDAGRDPAQLPDGQLWSEEIVEVQPSPPNGGTIVWEWHVSDHLIQDDNASKANYGVVADHPELMDVNFVADSSGHQDWLHANALDYNPQLDQIAISFRNTSEIWVIDHSTTTGEAASHTGGTSGKGGDILYRWGNPQAYRAGTESDRTLFGQHNVHWIEPGLSGAGHLLLFNNGNGRAGSYSSADEIVPPPIDSHGNYDRSPGQAYGPSGPSWTYALPASLYAPFISSAQRLPNGDTLIDSGTNGTFLEVAPDQTVVWKYINPVNEAGPLAQGLPVTGIIWVFRAYRYGADYPGLAGKDLTPGAPLEVLDSDGDGCPNLAELQTTSGSELSGGRRDPLNPWDYFNPTHDGKNRVDDILAVVQHFGKNQGDAGYSSDFDRTYIGPNPWNLGPPDGHVTISDILAILVQFGHDCS